MKIKTYEFVLEAYQPIAHHSETFGNEAVAMRRKVRQSDGSWAMVPIVTGDTMRHGLREAAAYAFLDAAGLLDEGNLTESALRLLFSGGMMTGRGDAGTIKLDDFRQMVELCPPLALLGGCAGNRVIPGRLQVDDAQLICSETERFMPAWLKGWLGERELDTCRASIEEVQRVRMDPTLDPGKVKLLADGEQVRVAGRLGAGEKAHAEDDAIARDESKSSMMPRKFERLAQGSQFHWSVTATCYSDLDEDTLHTMMGVFLSRAYVGGKRGTGHGLLVPIEGRDVAVRRPSDTSNVDVKALSTGKVGDLFREHVSARREQIKDWLNRVDA